jgi:protein-disulfide isomerase
LYLSPDFRFLAFDLYDTNVDPVSDEAKARGDLMKALQGGSPPSLGKVDAKVTVVEFSDYECEYCKRFETMMQKEVMLNSSGVRFIVRDFPLEIHPWAQEASLLAVCAQQQDSKAFWQLRSFIYDNQESLNINNIRDRVRSFVNGASTIDLNRFDRCRAAPETAAAVAADIKLGRGSGVTATPTYFINGARFTGVPTGKQMEAFIHAAESNTSIQLKPVENGAR